MCFVCRAAFGVLSLDSLEVNGGASRGLVKGLSPSSRPPSTSTHSVSLRAGSRSEIAPHVLCHQPPEQSRRNLRTSAGRTEPNVAELGHTLSGADRIWPEICSASGRAWAKLFMFGWRVRMELTLAFLPGVMFDSLWAVSGRLLRGRVIW